MLLAKAKVNIYVYEKENILDKIKDACYQTSSIYFSVYDGLVCYEIIHSSLKPWMASLCVINHAALADHIHLDLSGIFKLRFNLLGDIAGQQDHIGI